jgi:20S proteasome alpha/beta subunit
MTAIVGIKSYSNSKEIILAADSQMTDFEDNRIPVSKVTGFNKIANGKDWAMGFAGIYCPPLRSFFKNLKSEASSKNIIENAIQSKYFEEVNDLNTKIARKYGDDCSAHFLLASSKPELGIYFVDKMGNVLERPVGEDDNLDYLTIGSGSDSARNYLERKIDNKYLDSDGLTHAMALKYAYESIEQEDDLYTGGPIEIVVVKEDSVNNYGSRLRRAARKAVRTELEDIIKESER